MRDGAKPQTIPVGTVTQARRGSVSARMRVRVPFGVAQVA